MKIRRNRAINIVKENTVLKEENSALKEELVYEKGQWDSHFKKGKDSFVNDDDTVRGES
jgi:regulator of replication initiation timing